MGKELPKAYEPQEVEGRIYEMWEKGGCFQGHRDPDKKPFTIVMPPPNVTGQLHMGHAMDCTLQDILTRFKRMEGYAALWVPGADHAGIATQIKVEEELRENEGLSRYDLGREKFLERVWGPVHHGRGPFQGGAACVRLSLREGADLQGLPHHQLVSPLRHRTV